MGFTGLVWTGFAVGHLTGNLLLFAGREAFNTYAHFLESLGHGVAIYLVEAALALVLLIHVWNGLTIVFGDKARARNKGYEVSGNAGGRSRKTLASQNMIWTGLTILGFLVLHIATFKYAVGGEFQDYTLHDGTVVKDLYQLVVWRFSQAPYVGIYTVVMCLLGMHLKHGVWSAFQSLGLLNKKTLPVAVTLATLLAVLLTVGFLALPTTIYLFNPMFAEGQGGIHL